MICSIFRNDVHLISQERNHHKEAYQGVDRDNATLRTEIKHVLAKVDRLSSSKVPTQVSQYELSKDS